MTWTIAVVTLGGGIFIAAVPCGKPLLDPHDVSIRHTEISTTAAQLAKKNLR
jgi:hypothetical protein